ncbi:MAG: gamma-glutamylcyclotransferase family protein [Planctomycetota bacterium]
MSERSLYFAYGSNLDPVQMKRRCPGSEPVGPAFAAGWVLTFPVRSGGDWQGGVASIETPDALADPAEPQATLDGGVWGVVYRVTDDDLSALDVYEAIAEGMYVRGKVDVSLDRECNTAVTYFAARGYNAPDAPSTKYLSAIVGGAEFHGLPELYLDRLRAIPTND